MHRGSNDIEAIIGGGFMATFGVGNFTLNQYSGSVNYNMDKNSIFWVYKSEKGRIVEFGSSLQNIRLNIWGPQNIRLNI